MKHELHTASLYALPGIPLVKPGDDLAHISLSVLQAVHFN